MIRSTASLSKAVKEAATAVMEARINDPAPFTYSGLAAGVYASLSANDVPFSSHEKRNMANALADRFIQKSRKAGKIAFQREGRLTLWSKAFVELAS